MLHVVQRVRDLRRLDQQSLSICVVGAYILGALVHRPDEHRKFNGVRDLLAAHRNEATVASMFQSLFTLNDQGIFVLSQVLPWDVLALHYSSAIIRDANASFAVPTGIPLRRNRSPSPELTPPPVTRRRPIVNWDPPVESTSRVSVSPSPSASVSSFSSFGGIPEPSVSFIPSPSFSASSFDVPSGSSVEPMDLSNSPEATTEPTPSEPVIEYDPTLPIEQLSGILSQIVIRRSLVNGSLVVALNDRLQQHGALGLNFKYLEEKNNYWKKTKALFCTLPLDHPELPRLFAELLFSELTEMYNSWKNILQPQHSVDSVYALGHRLWKGYTISDYVMEGRFFIDTRNAHIDTMLNRLLPSIPNLQQDINYYLHLGKAAYKKYGSRNWFILLAHYHKDNINTLAALTRIQQNVISYIKSNYTIMPVCRDDKIYNNHKSTGANIHLAKL